MNLLQVFEEGDSIDALVLVPRPASILSLSRQGTILRAWNALDGTLLWERVVANAPTASKSVITILPDVTGDGSSDIFIAADSKAQVCAPGLHCFCGFGHGTWTSPMLLDST